jgi:S-adenosylmethionine:tRNA ribosyltransferase-isomerase
MESPMFLLDDYAYHLPEELIAQYPVLPPEQARLLIYDRHSWTIQDKHFFDLPAFLTPESLLIFNDSKVVKARILFPDINAELLFLTAHSAHEFEALVSSGKQRSVGNTHTIAGSDVTFTVLGQNTQGKILSCSHPILDVLDTYGQMPLPPYITYNDDVARHYQPIIANEQKSGSVASPTAALHFSKHLLDSIRQSWSAITSVTLHIWIGTFRSVVVDNITDHDIHEEICDIDRSLFTTLALQKKAKNQFLQYERQPREH